MLSEQNGVSSHWGVHWGERCGGESKVAISNPINITPKIIMGVFKLFDFFFMLGLILIDI